MGDMKKNMTMRKAGRAMNIDGVRRNITGHMGVMNMNTAIRRFNRARGFIQEKMAIPGGIRKNLQRANLRVADLEEANLAGADLRGAYLAHANLRWANLQGANLEGAMLRGAFLMRADLQEANLEAANLIYATLRWANLQRANLQMANFCLLYTSPSPRDRVLSRMPSSA